MTNICYHTRTSLILGIGETPEDAIVDARWNGGDPDIDTSEWATIAATDDLIHEIEAQGGDLSWAIVNGTAICV